MKKVFQLVDLDCANCARKMTLTADAARIDSILKQAVKACKKVEPDCEIILK